MEQDSVPLASRYSNLWRELKLYTQAEYFSQNEVGSGMW